MSRFKSLNLKYPAKNLAEVEIENCLELDDKLNDIIRSKNRMDLELIKLSVREYIKRKDKDLVRLSLYAEKLDIKEMVMDYVGMMYE